VAAVVESTAVAVALVDPVVVVEAAMVAPITRLLEQQTQDPVAVEQELVEITPPVMADPVS
jgi:hypothetical protein